MRIATSSIYDQQTTSIDTLSSQYQNVGNQLSTGKSLNVPSDDPAVVSQDLTLTNRIDSEDADSSNAVAAQNQLTNTDSILSSLTTVLQQARSLAVQGATDIIPNGTQRPLIGKQVSGLLQQAIALANSQYGNTYVFAGTGERSTAPVQANGVPPTGVNFNGNLNTQTELINGQPVDVGTTLQQAFNYQSADGTPDVFQVLATLANTLTQEPSAVESQAPINNTGDVIYGNASPAPTTLGQIAGPPPLTTTQLKADSTGQYSINISGTSPTTGATGSVTLTFTNATPLDGPGGVIQQINGATATTGVSAVFNAQTQRVTLTSVAPNSPPFAIQDVPTPGPPAATDASNLLSGVLQIPSTVDVVTNLSTQIYNIDQVTNAVLSGRAQIGQNIQNLASTTNQLQSESTDNTTTKSGYEDTNIAQATSQFSLIQTALQGAYSTTTRLESKTLLDYLPA